MKQGLVDADGGGDGESQEKKRSPGLRGAFEWFMESPWTRWPFALFILFGLASLLWLILYFAEPSMGYMLAGISAIVMSLYGAYHFKILLGLKEQVDQYANLNKQFKQENAALRKEVDKLSHARVRLQTVQGELSDSNKTLAESLEKFRTLEANLQASSADNIEGLGEILKQSKAVVESMNEQCQKSERAILKTVKRKVWLNVPCCCILS